MVITGPELKYFKKKSTKVVIRGTPVSRPFRLSTAIPHQMKHKQNDQCCLGIQCDRNDLFKKLIFACIVR